MNEKRKQELFDVANKYYNNREFKEAIKEYDELLKIDAKIPEAWNNKGMAHLELGEFGEALESFKKALDIDPKFILSSVNKAIAHSELGQHDEAEVQLREALSLDSAHTIAMPNYVNFLINKSRDTEAIDFIDRSLKLSPDDPNLWSLLGDTYVRLAFNKDDSPENFDRYLKAISSYERLTQLDATRYDSMKNKGISLNKIGRYKESVESLEKFIQLNPKDDQALFYYANSLNKVGQKGKALEIYNQVLRLTKSESHRVLNNMGLIYVDLKEYDNAIESFERALNVNPQYTAALLNISGPLLELGKYDEALESINKVLNTRPEGQYSDRAWYNRGLLLLRKEQYSEAKGAFEKALSINGSNYDAMNNLAIALKHLKKYDEALDNLDKILSKNPNDTYALGNKAAVFNEMGAQDESMRILYKALEIEPDNHFFHNNIGSLFFNQGKYNESIFHFERAIKNLKIEALSYQSRESSKSYEHKSLPNEASEVK